MHEDHAGFVGFAAPLGFDHGSEAAVDEHVEIFGDGVKGDEVFDVEVFGDLEGKFGIIEEGIENTEAVGFYSVLGLVLWDL